MAKIIGNTTATTSPQSDWDQTDTTKADYIKNKPISLPADGGDADTVNGHTIEADVPADLATLLGSISTNYDESIIGLSVDGQTVTYIKGDGSTHSFTTQDTDTTYSLGTDTVTGLTKLYATTGSAEDGTMTQKAIKTELDKKVGVTINQDQNILVFTV